MNTPPQVEDFASPIPSEPPSDGNCSTPSITHEPPFAGDDSIPDVNEFASFEGENKEACWAYYVVS